ncbi:MAG: hypothetical protein KAY24_12960, partial [Candidatus Eisenbacteria sp.]|nr:hypothetical protein [Candidatus Eisenbacteria bacterium]
PLPRLVGDLWGWGPSPPGTQPSPLFPPNPGYRRFVGTSDGGNEVASDGGIEGAQLVRLTIPRQM